MKTLFPPRHWLGCFLIAALLTCLWVGIPRAEAQIELSLSVKFFLDGFGRLPNNGGPGYGASSFALTNATAVISNVNYANSLLDRLGRGYRFRLIEVTNVSGLSSWYNTPARSVANRDALEDAATTFPAAYRWRSDAVNIYINNTSAGICSFPPPDPDSGFVIFIGSSSYDTLLLHESMHFFDLHHTHDGELGLDANNLPCTTQPPCACAEVRSGDLDGTSETAPDSQCWNTRDQVAMGAYNLNYTSLDADRRWRVDNTWRNVISYHNGGGPGNTNLLDVLTPDQLDRATDAINGPRFHTASAKTVFVDRNTGLSVDDAYNTLPSIFRSWVDSHPLPGESWGSSRCLNVFVDPPLPPRPPGWIGNWPPTIPDPPRPPSNVYPSDWPWPPIDPSPIGVCLGGPRGTVSLGITQASPGDVVLVRAGHYNEPQRITKRLTLRATRGNVALGKP